MILAGDIGGTSTRLALFSIEQGKLVQAALKKYHSRDHQALAEIVKVFTREHPENVEHAAFGIAGPVRGGKVHTPNLPWTVDAEMLSQTIGVADVHLLNDLEANAHGIPVLSATDFETLNPGNCDKAGNAAVISAGTGLGEAGIIFDGQKLHPFACEGGHCDLAPRDDREIALLDYLRKRFMTNDGDHVSFERVVSGPGLVNVYEFLRDTGQEKESPAVVEAMRTGDAAAAISKAALDGSCPLCIQAMSIFVSMYGAAAGNLALKMLATRGVYLGGGIAPKILKVLKSPAFFEAFCAKGRMRPLMEQIPIYVILNEYTALLGSARYAAERAGLLPPWTV